MVLLGASPPARFTKNDIGGEVFERIKVAPSRPLGRPKCRRTGHQKPTSAIVVKLAGPESTRVRTSPPVSLLVKPLLEFGWPASDWRSGEICQDSPPRRASAPCRAQAPGRCCESGVGAGHGGGGPAGSLERC